MKSKLLAYLLWFFLGAFSIHRFYLGKVGTGILYLLTGQLFFIGWVIDFFILGGMVDRYNLMHGYIGPNRNLSQNVVVNIASPTYAPPPNYNLPTENRTSINESHKQKIEDDYSENDLV